MFPSDEVRKYHKHEGHKHELSLPVGGLCLPNYRADATSKWSS